MKAVNIIITAAIITCCLWGTTAWGTLITYEYEFVPDQSEVIKSGGFAGQRYTYSIEGQFQLIVDYDADSASFDQVNATTSEPIWYLDVVSGYYIPTQSLNVLFHMTELESTYVSDMQIDFLLEIECPLGGNKDIRIRATFMDDLLYLTGGFREPGYDTYQFDLDAFAVVIPEPTTFFLLGAGCLLVRGHIFREYKKFK